MTSPTQKASFIPYLWGVVIFALLISVGALAYFYLTLQTQVEALQTQAAQLESEKATVTQELLVAQSSIRSLEETLAEAEEELEELEDDYRKERNKNEEFEDQIRDITGTVANLDKLSKTDEELLQKYSKVYFLNENFVPSDLDQINNKYVHDSKDDEYFHADAMSFLEDLMDDARRDGVDIEIISAYRSFDEQVVVKNGHMIVYGTGANAFSADQGYSEHQLGTAVDFGTSEIANARNEFANTEAYEWLLKNAYKHGFTLSYPEGNNFYIFEPWHWRFVGEELARDLHKDNAHFYDWEQRKIDSYLISIFD